MSMPGPKKHQLKNVKAFAHLVTPRFFSETNTNLEALRRSLEVLLNEQKVLPRRLHLQLDNTSKDQKNKYFLAFIAFLVASSVFDTIELMFLQPGHTHEDVDQMFSCFARRLQAHPAYTIPDLMDCLETSYTPQPEVVLVDSVIDYVRFLSPHFIKEWKVRDWHALRVSQDSATGDVIAEYKRWMSDDVWIRGPDRIMFELAKGFQKHQDTKLNFVAPAPLRVEPLEAMLERRARSFAVSNPKRVAPLRWWHRWISRERSDQRSWCPVCSTIKSQRAEITIHQSDETQVKSQKARQRKDLQEKLKAHRVTCPWDRVAAASPLLSRPLRSLAQVQSAAATQPPQVVPLDEV